MHRTILQKWAKIRIYWYTVLNETRMELHKANYLPRSPLRVGYGLESTPAENSRNSVSILLVLNPPRCNVIRYADDFGHHQSIEELGERSSRLEHF